MADIFEISGRIHSTSQEEVVTTSSEILDEEQNKKQSEVNADVDTALADRYTKEETYSKSQLDNLITTPDVQYVTVATYSALPAEGAADTIYRVSCWDGSQVDATKYTLYAWNGSGYTELAVRSGSLDGVFDISVNNPDNGQPSQYDDLEASLGNNGANVPIGVRAGGMQVRFINFSTGKYEQYRYMGTDVTTDATFTNVSNWQGVDETPTAGSQNLVESGGVKTELMKIVGDYANLLYSTVSDSRVKSTGAIENASNFTVYKYDVRNITSIKITVSATATHSTPYCAFYEDSNYSTVVGTPIATSSLKGTTTEITVPDGANYFAGSCASDNQLEVEGKNIGIVDELVLDVEELDGKIDEVDATVDKIEDDVLEIKYSKNQIYDNANPEILNCSVNLTTPPSVTFGDIFRTLVIRCKPNTDYVVSWDNTDVPNRTYIGENSSVPESNSSITNIFQDNRYPVVSENGRSYKAIKTSFDTVCLLFYYYKTDVTGVGEANVRAKIMVSEGTERLPYQNYVPSRYVVKKSALPEDSVGDDNREIIANRYDNYVNQRIEDLRNAASFVTPSWYGSEWSEGVEGVTAINSEGDSSLHTSLPIQSKMRRCVIKDGVIQYYLDENDSTLKENGTAAKLDGTDGDVCVEIPEFFFRFEESEVDDHRHIKLKISEYGLDGFTYSPKMHISAYEATMNRATGKLASVCTTLLTFTTQEVSISNIDSYVVGSYSLGQQKTATRTGFTDNAADFRGGNNDDTYDSETTDGTDNYWLNQLGTPVARVCRDGYKDAEVPEKGKLMYTYDAFRALWILSMVEFKTMNIQLDTALGRGATVYGSYTAFKTWRADTTESLLPCGVTNCLGNKSGQVYIRLNNVPRADGRADVWIPVLSYRGVENWYGHIYNTISQINLYCKSTGETTDDADGHRNIYDVEYYYQRNPFITDNELHYSEKVGTYRFCPATRCTTSYVFGQFGHILPKDSSPHASGYSNLATYCDCVEDNNAGGPYAMDVNGSIISGELPGRAFQVGMYSPSDQVNVRNSNGTRLTILLAK